MSVRAEKDCHAVLGTGIGGGKGVVASGKLEKGGSGGIGVSSVFPPAEKLVSVRFFPPGKTELTPISAPKCVGRRSSLPVGRRASSGPLVQARALPRRHCDVQF